MCEIENQNKMTEIFKFSDPDKIATIIIEELNDIAEKLAPKKILQRKKEDEIPHDEESRQLKSESDRQLEYAINSGDRDELRAYNRIENKYQKKISKNKQRKLK